MIEDKIQADIFLKVWNYYTELRGLLFHVPNGKKRNKIDAAILKGMGVVRGVADLLFFYQGKTYAFEVKTDVGTQSDEQIWWQGVVTKHGVTYYIVRSEEEFFSIFDKILKDAIH